MLVRGSWFEGLAQNRKPKQVWVPAGASVRDLESGLSFA